MQRQIGIIIIRIGPYRDLEWIPRFAPASNAAAAARLSPITPRVE
jgi:hypothetical protein